MVGVSGDGLSAELARFMFAIYRNSTCSLESYGLLQKMQCVCTCNRAQGRIIRKLTLMHSAHSNAITPAHDLQNCRAAHYVLTSNAEGTRKDVLQQVR